MRRCYGCPSVRRVCSDWIPPVDAAPGNLIRHRGTHGAGDRARAGAAAHRNASGARARTEGTERRDRRRGSSNFASAACAGRQTARSTGGAATNTRAATDTSCRAGGGRRGGNAPRSSDREALESRIGSRWLLYVGVVAIVIGVSYFEKLAIDNHWVNETWRIDSRRNLGAWFVIGAGLRIVKKGYRLLRADSGRNRRRDALCLHVRGVQFLSPDQPSRGVHCDVWRSPRSPHWLANAERSQGLALVAVAAVLRRRFCSRPHRRRSGTLWIRHDPDRRDDAHRSTARLADTQHRQLRLHGLTFLSWAAVFYASATYLTTELFLTVFCGLFLYALHSAYRSTTPSAGSATPDSLDRAIWLYVLSLANLFDHEVALLIYLADPRAGRGRRRFADGSWIRLSSGSPLWRR